MMKTLGIDLGKSGLHAVGMDAAGKVVVRRKLDRVGLLKWLADQEPLLIGMEACAGAHHLARALRALGHDARLMPAQYVKPFVKTQKNDWNDAEACAEAVQRPRMRFVPVKAKAQLDVQAVHRVRQRLIGMRTALINQIRGFLLENGIALPRGRRALERALAGLPETAAQAIGPGLGQLISMLRESWRWLDQKIGALDDQILALARGDAASRRLMTIPGIGPLTATALVAAIGPVAEGFRDSRSLPAWLGLVPRQHSTGGKATLLGVSPHGNRHLRRLLVLGAQAVQRVSVGRTDRLGRWLEGLACRAHRNVVTVALAARLARYAWAILAKGETWRAAA